MVVRSRKNGKMGGQLHSMSIADLHHLFLWIKIVSKFQVVLSSFCHFQEAKLYYCMLPLSIHSVCSEKKGFPQTQSDIAFVGPVAPASTQPLAKEGHEDDREEGLQLLNAFFPFLLG